MSTTGQQAPREKADLKGVSLGTHQDQRSYLGIGQVPEGLAGLQWLQELNNGSDATFRQQHATQAAKAAEDLL